MKKAVIFARVSSTNDRQNTDRQVKDLEDYALAMRYDVLKIFEEHISGGKLNEERPVLQEALEFCRLNQIDIILTSEISRLGRNAIELLDIVRQLAKSGINLYLQKEQFTLLDREGKISPFATIFLATLSACSELERENIKYRLNSGRKRYIDQGGRLGRPSGTVLTSDQLLTKHKDIVKLVKQGYPIRKIATLTGKSPSTVARVKNKIREKD